MPREIKLIITFLISFSSLSYAQDEIGSNSNFIAPEYMIGKIIPASKNFSFPETNFQQVFALNYGFTNNDTTKWGRYYNLPETGIMFLYSNLGNNSVLGHQFGFLPFVTLRVFNKTKSPMRLKLGAGFSYFTHHFDSISNPNNEVIGSHFAWDVKALLYKSIYKNNGVNLRLGLGFSHESNGHTRIPNLGVNSVLVSLSSQFYKDEKDNYSPSYRIKRRNISEKNYFITFEQSLGMHDQSKSEGPEMGNLKPVFVSDLSASVLFNKHLKLRAGFSYRFYKTYYDHVVDNEVENLIESPKMSSSNFSIYAGNEFLMGHFSIDALLGVNLYKPFFNQFNGGTDIGVVLQKIFLTRIGLNLYLINTHKLPKHNVFVGAHIKANMGRADYSDISFGYTYNLSK